MKSYKVSKEGTGNKELRRVIHLNELQATNALNV